VLCAVAGCRADAVAVEAPGLLAWVGVGAAGAAVLHDVSARPTMAVPARRGRLSLMRPRMLRDDEKMMKGPMP
jgi:hypothetical protein